MLLESSEGKKNPEGELRWLQNHQPEKRFALVPGAQLLCNMVIQKWPHKTKGIT